MQNNNKDLSKIELLVLDVDGVLSDGSITYSSSGDELKTFNVKDGAGLKYWKRAGCKFAVITGRKSVAVERRATELDADAIRQDCKNKLPVLEEVMQTLGYTPDQVAVVGDDLPDLPMMYESYFAACPADAVSHVQDYVDYKCKLPGGAGCVREVVEMILQASGRWDSVFARYLPKNKDA